MICFNFLCRGNIPEERNGCAWFLTDESLEKCEERQAFMSIKNANSVDGHEIAVGRKFLEEKRRRRLC